jgi:type IV secretory pathway VirB2 component (pilin)
MVWTRHVLSALVAVASFATAAQAESAPAPSPRLNEVFKSLQESTQGTGIDVPWVPLAIVAIAAVGMTVAIKHWSRRRANPKPLNDQRRLLDEASRAAGIAKRKLKQIAPLAQAEGLSSPLVAMLCPSAIKRLADHVKTSDEQEALRAVTESLFRAEGRGRPTR